MPRVVHLISSRDRRGAQVFASQLVDELGGAPDHRLVAVTEGSGGHRVDAVALGTRRWDARGVRRLVSTLRGADVLVAHGSSALLHGAAASRLAHRPFVYRNIGDPSTWGSVRGASLRVGAPLRAAAAVSALYPEARRHLIDAYRLDPDRVVTIPNGVAERTAATRSDGAAARVTLELDEQLTWIGFIGALSEEKGILAAIDAVAADPTLGLVVAGDGPQRDEAHERAATRAPDRVRFLGVVEDPDIVLAAVRAVVMPSRTEGIPAVAIEAGLSGRPVVATRVGGLPDVIDDGITGVLVDGTSPEELLDAVARAVRSGDELGSAARERCRQRFTMPQVAARWATLLDEVAQRRVPASST